MAVVALSCDPVDVLARFAEAQGITFPLLSDDGSVVIERLGLLNPAGVTEASRARLGIHERYLRVPYPGTIELDADGVVSTRIFDDFHRERPAPGALLRRLTGAPPEAARSASAAGEAVAVTAWVDAASFRPMERAELYVRLEVADGWHVYVPPTPDGFVALDVSLRPVDGLTTWPVALPAGRPFSVEGLADAFRVVDGTVELVVPWRLSGSRYEAGGNPRAEPGEPAPVTLSLDVRFQTCSERECLLPETLQLDLQIDEEAHVPRPA